jgi:hypothetical protein
MGRMVVEGCRYSQLRGVKITKFQNFNTGISELTHWKIYNIMHRVHCGDHEATRLLNVAFAEIRSGVSKPSVNLA